MHPPAAGRPASSARTPRTRPLIDRVTAWCGGLALLGLLLVALVSCGEANAMHTVPIVFGR